MNSSLGSTSFVAAASSPVVEMAGISKRFTGTVALDNVSLEVFPGEVAGLIGENGAGKSTLMKILAGILPPDAGQVRMNAGLSVSEIAIIHQELNLLENLDIAANVFLGREPTWGGAAKFLDRNQIEKDTLPYLARLGLKASPRALVGGLSTAQQQLVEIARALSLNARVLIMDEPTSSLTMAEAGRLFEVVGDLRAQGVSIIYVSHRLPEIQKLADRVIVLRDGRNAGALQRHEINHDKMVRLMVGRDVNHALVRKSSIDARIYLEVDRVRTRRYPDSEITLSIRTGEILGLAGLVGAGRSELAEAIFGVEPALSGSIVLNGMPLKCGSAQDAIRHGIYLIPEDRRRSGIIGALTIRENVTLPSISEYAFWGWIRHRREVLATDSIRNRMGIKSASAESAVQTLSGGNQQKVVLAKWLCLNPKLIIFDEPTRGIDVGAKYEIHQLIRSLAEQGVAVLMISSDMEEILAISDRVAVMHEGRITGTLEGSECTEEAIMRLAVA